MMHLKWKQTETGAMLLHLETDMEEVVIPDEVEGIPITEIGDYCFSGRGRGMEGEVRNNVFRSISLPETVERIGDFAFYHCTKLEKIMFGKNLKKIGSDAFMNCFRLNTLTVRAKAEEQTGLKQILAQISGTITVTFESNGNCDAQVLYPEYAETYDEISPAHIFGRNIEGEGFRARQCFVDGKLDFYEYDKIFQKVCVEEEGKVRIQFALNRLRYPVELKEEKRLQYEEYLRENAEKEANYFLKKRKKEELFFLCEHQYLTEKAMTELIQQSTELDWAEGTASLLQWKAKFYQSQKKERYAFDEF